MRRTLFFFTLSTIFAATLVSIPARANELYIVQNVAVDVSDVSAVAARQKAIQEAQILGFHRLLRRITLQQDYDKLPRLSFEDTEPMINSFEIKDEKTSSTRYIANITINFNPDALRELLSGSGIGFLEVSPPTALVLPLYFDGTEWSLWRNSNTWWDAWRNLNSNLLSISYLLPLADLEDRFALSVDSIGDVSRLERLAQRYETDRILLAQARFNNSRVDVNVTAYRILRENFEAQRLAQFNFTSTNMNDAVKKIATQIEQNWKKQSIRTQDAPSTFRLRARFRSIQEWTQIRRQLESAPYIRTLQVEEMDIHNAWLRLGFNGGGQTLVAGLRRSGFLVSQENIDTWALRLSEFTP